MNYIELGSYIQKFEDISLELRDSGNALCLSLANNQDRYIDGLRRANARLRREHSHTRESMKADGILVEFDTSLPLEAIVNIEANTKILHQNALHIENLIIPLRWKDVFRNIGASRGFRNIGMTGERQVDIREQMARVAQVDSEALYGLAMIGKQVGISTLYKLAVLFDEDEEKMEAAVLMLHIEGNNQRTWNKLDQMAQDERGFKTLLNYIDGELQ